VIAIDIHGDRTVTDFSGLELTEKEFAELENTNFTPSLIFYDRRGTEVLRLRGYYPPYKFQAALEYVADGHYRKEGFRDYLERADPTLTFEAGELIEEPFFGQPPFALDRSRVLAQLPLAVFFEQSDCHACDVLHSGPLKSEAIQERLEKFEVVQLDMWGDTPVITPGGQQTTSRKWAEQLGLFYAPTLIFFDESGNVIIRVDSVVRFFRLQRVLDYVASGVYKKGITIQRWRRIQAGIEKL
jgi:thioredoxin-related protein